MNEIIWIDDTALTIRPIEVADIDRLERMFSRLSPESVLFRFFSPIPRLPRSTLTTLADVDHNCRDALVALDGDEIVAIARYHCLAPTAQSGSRDAEIALTVEDAWQRRGLGRRLARRLGVLARCRGFDSFVARILPGNRGALVLTRKLVPHADVHFVDGDYEARLPLDFWPEPSN